MPNYIKDKNRFAMAEPPAWWLTMLSDFDDKLVVVPSRQHPVYILARRAKLGPLHPKLKEMKEISADANTQMLAGYGLVYVTVLEPVTTGVVSFINWSTAIFNELRKRDLWAYGGANNYIKTVEEFEASQEAKLNANIAAEADYRSRDAWRSLQWRTGQRIQSSGQPRTAAPVHSERTGIVLTNA